MHPLRGRAFWGKVSGVHIHPPLYTKVMGRPKKNRKKAPEEKLKKGVTTLSRHGVTMHCSICGGPDHNKKGHDNYMLRVQDETEENAQVWEEDANDPSILQHITQQYPLPQLDPMQQTHNMVFRMGQEERNIAPNRKAEVPLPESAFVAAARESILLPNTRVTTASTRGNLRGRGRGRGRASSRSNATAPTTTAASTSGSARATGNKRTVASTSGRGATWRRNYRTGTCSTYHLMFGDDEQRGQNGGQGIPYLNAATDETGDEILVSQNAPTDGNL